MDAGDALMGEIILLRQKIWSISCEHFLTRELFSWVWWLGLALGLAVAVAWWKLADKRMLMELCVFGLIVMAESFFLDIAGSDLGLWEYVIRIVPQNSLVLPIDFIVVPCVHTFIFQRWRRWGAFLAACAAAAAVLAFAMEPFAVWAGQYRLITWKYIYSFPIYILISAAAKFIAQKLTAAKARYNSLDENRQDTEDNGRDRSVKCASRTR